MTNTAWGQQQPDHVVSIEKTKLKKLLKLALRSTVLAPSFSWARHIIKFYDDRTGQGLLRRGDERLSYINGFRIYRGIFRIVI